MNEICILQQTSTMAKGTHVVLGRLLAVGQRCLRILRLVLVLGQLHHTTPRLGRLSTPHEGSILQNIFHHLLAR